MTTSTALDYFGGAVSIAGLALFHSLWQILLIAMVTAIVVRSGNGIGFIKSASSRYLVQYSGLLLMAVAPLATFVILLNSNSSSLLNQSVVQTQPNTTAAGYEMSWGPMFGSEILDSAGRQGGNLSYSEKHAPLLSHSQPPRIESNKASQSWVDVFCVCTFWLWLIGALIMLLHSSLQLWRVQRLRRFDIEEVSKGVAQRLEQLVTQLGVWQTVKILQSSMVGVPTLVGWLRPVILLPSAMLTGLTPRELELILLHELIHIRRFDFAFNVIQSVVESLLFYHPCVWWLSRNIRVEREYAADEAVVELTREGVTYARALMRIEQLRSTSQTSVASPTIAATGGPLKLRIQKIVSHAAEEAEATSASKANSRLAPRRPRLRSSSPIALAVSTAVVAIIICIFPALSRTHESEKMPDRYSDTFTRMQRPDLSFGYGETDVNDLQPWQAPFGMASREIDYDDGWELWCAAADGKADIVKRLIEKDPRLKDLAFRYHCPLDLAVYGGHTDCVRILLDAGTELTEKWGWYGWKRMMSIATEMGHDEIHDMMLERIKETLNYHPDIQLMIQALCDQDLERMKKLIDEEPNRVRIADADGNTALHWAVFARQIPMIDLLVESGADPSRRNGASAMPHQVKMWTNLKTQMVRGLDTWEHEVAARDRLLELGAEVDFHTAIDKRNFDLVKKMLADDPSLVHHMPGHLQSPLKRAVGNVEMIQLLLDHGADPNMTEHTAPFGCALYTAVAGNNYDSAKLLLENGAEPMQYSDSSGDCLFAANLWIKDEGDRKRMIELLNKYSGKEFIVIPQRNDKPEHAVAAAAVREVLARDSVTNWQVGHLLDVILIYDDLDLLDEYIERFGQEAKSRIAEVDSQRYEGRLLDRLTELGAKKHPVSTKPVWIGATVLHWNRNISLVAEFVEAGGDINSVNLEMQRTALSNAAAQGDIEMVRELLKHGADPNLPIRFVSNRPISLAGKAGHQGIVELLRHHGAELLSQTKPEAKGSGFVSTAIPPEGGTKNKVIKNDFSYDGVDMADPVNQWQKAIETRDANEVARLLKLHPDYANMKIMDRYRDGRLNTKDHHQEALDHMARTGDLEIAKLLVEAGASEARIQGAFMIAEPNVAEYLLEHCDDPKPNIDLMAYVAKWESLEFWFKRGYKPDLYSLHNASSGRPSMRHFAARDDSKGKWKERFRDTVRVLLEAGADPNERHRSGNVKWDGAKPWRNNSETPLHHAAASHDIVLIQQLLDAGADKTLTNDLGDTPCCWAIRFNAPTEVIELLDFEGNPRRNPELFNAAHAGDLDEVKKLIEAGADPNAYDENGAGTLLNFHPKVTTYLLEKGANPDLQRNENILPVLVGLAGFNTECVKAMLKAGANPNIICEHNAETALHHAVCGDRIEEVRALLEAGADPNERTHSGRTTYMLWRDARVRGETPLHRAAAYGTPEVIKLLLENGADPTKQDANKDTPLSWASWHHRDKSIIDMLAYEGSGVGPDYPPADWKPFKERESPRNAELIAAALAGDLNKLVEGGADPNSIDSNGMGPLLNFHPKVTEYLLAKGADPNIQRNENILPVISGVAGNFECVKLMLDAGADVNRASAHNGETVLHYAASGHNIELMKMVIEAGANVNARTIPGMRTYAMWRDVRVRGETPLHRAAAWGTAESIQMLLDAGADPTIRDANGDSPLSWASWYMRDRTIIDLLSNAMASGGSSEVSRRTSSGTGLKSSDIEKFGKSGDFEKVVTFLDGKKGRQDEHDGQVKGTEDVSFKEHHVDLVNPVQKFLPPDHPFIIAIREVDLTQVKELIVQDKSLVSAQVRGDIALTGKVWKDGQHVEVGEDAVEHAGPLHFAAFIGNEELAQLLIDSGADINAPAAFGEKKATPVTIAAWEGNEETLKVILEAARASGLALKLKPALFTSLVHRSKEKTALLIEYGAEHDVFTAAMAGESEVLKRLIQSKPDSVNLKHPEYGRTPLEQALKVGQTEMAELLAAHGADVTPPSAAAMGRVDEVNALIKNDSEATTRRYGSFPLLIWAISGQQAEMTKFLLEQGADPDGGDRWGYSPLSHVANVKGETGATLVDLLVAAGADPMLESRDKTPIEWALEARNKDVHHRLVHHIEFDVDVSEDEDGFWKAVGEGDLATVKAYLGTNSSLASKRFPMPDSLFFLTDGLPLFVAAANGHWKVAQLLLDHGADPDAKRDLEESRILGLGDDHRELGKPILFAYAQGNFEMVNMLLDKGASVHAHGYCDIPFATQVFRDATAAGAPSSMVLRSVPDLAKEDQKKIAPVSDDAPEVIKLYDRILTLGAIPNHYSLADVGDYETIKLLLEKHPGGISNDHWGGNVHEALLYGSAWFGYDKVVEMCMDIRADRHTTYAAQHCIRNAITSHNRPGSFEGYYRTIELNLDYLNAHNAFDEHDMFLPMHCLADGYIKNKCHGPCPEPPTAEQQLKLARLCLEKGVDINRLTPDSKLTALDLALLHDQKEYVAFLRENGGKQTPEGEKLVKDSNSRGS